MLNTSFEVWKGYTQCRGRILGHPYKALNMVHMIGALFAQCLINQQQNGSTHADGHLKVEEARWNIVLFSSIAVPDSPRVTEALFWSSTSILGLE
jgi:hypothetical protein